MYVSPLPLALVSSVFLVGILLSVVLLAFSYSSSILCSLVELHAGYHGLFSADFSSSCLWQWLVPRSCFQRQLYFDSFCKISLSIFHTFFPTAPMIMIKPLIPRPFSIKKIRCTHQTYTWSYRLWSRYNTRSSLWFVRCLSRSVCTHQRYTRFYHLQSRYITFRVHFLSRSVCTHRRFIRFYRLKIQHVQSRSRWLEQDDIRTIWREMRQVLW